MKQPIKNFLSLLAATALVPLAVPAQGTAFTYQGRLIDGPGPANGTYNLRFALFDALTVGNQVGSPLTNAPVSVSNGLFTVALDFGANFPGADRWLEIAVRPNGGGAFTTLIPRQPITASLTGSVPSAALTSIPAGNLTGTISDARLSANVSLLGASIESAEITDGTITPGDLNLTAFNPTFWRTVGNAGTTPGLQFLGTTDNQPLEFKVNNQRGLRLEPTASTDTVNVIGGSARNSVGAGVVGATIGGGGAGNYGGSAYTNRVEADFGTISGGLQNTIQTSANSATLGGGIANTIQTGASYATLGGGLANTIQPNAIYATLGGGNQNTIETTATYATLGGGLANTIQNSTDFGTVSGGHQNTIQPYANGATIGGGYQNTIQPSGVSATIPGGVQNSAASYAFAAGSRAKANHTGAFVWADSTAADFASTAANQFAIRASGGVVLSDSTPSLSFGNTTRQMLNLFGTDYGLGVQFDSLYFRCPNFDGNSGFSWYKGGVHSDGYAQPGAGGIELMHLIDGGLFVHGTVFNSSDRNIKQDFAAVNSRTVLEKVAQLPIQTWAYKNDPHTKHLGPVAQDFYAAFGVGPDDKHIATVDADGVALAAIQGLNQKLEAEVKSKDARIAELEQRLSAIETLLKK